MPEINAKILEGRYEDVLSAVQSPIIAITELVKNSADSCLSLVEPIIVSIETKQRIITITDFGEGLSAVELTRLGEAGYSSKMVGNNTRSPTDNPLSGSKGLGLLTAFFIADILEIQTYSVVDKKSYYLTWKKGEQKYSYDETPSATKGTVITLRDVSIDKLQMILLPEEKVKLFMASLRFFTDAINLPRIKLVIDGVEESYYPRITLQNYYEQNKGANNGFVARAKFRYEKNRIYLAYEDNVTGFYSFSDACIDLADSSSIERFAQAIHAPERGIAPIRSVCDSEVFESHFRDVMLPDFSGVFYIWRNRRSDDLDQWPAGVRIYINNYSLYRYLDKETDWLTLSEVSQNVKATNYKLKNTYGYIDITDYNENLEMLKISKERDDFVDSMAQRKFIHIMRDIVVGIYARIDIAVKNAPVQSFSLRYSSISIRLGEPLDLANVLACNNIGLDDISIEYNAAQLSVNDDWIVTALEAGSYEIKFTYSDYCRTLTIICKKVIPEFALLKGNVTFYQGNSINLRDYIDPHSCKDVTIESITISPEDKKTIIKDDIFDRNNEVGQHIVLFHYDEFQRTLIVNVAKLERQPGAGARSPRIDTLYPRLDEVRSCSYKLPELIDAISSYYMQAPTLCMAGVRVLLESAAKAFFLTFNIDEVDCSLPSLLDRIMNLRDCHPKNPDYQKYIESQGLTYKDRFDVVASKYALVLAKDVKENIRAHLKEIDLNMFIHNPNIIATDTTVYKSMQIFAPLLNFIFDVLLIG